MLLLFVTRVNITINFSLLRLALAKPKRLLPFKATRIYRYNPLDGNKLSTEQQYTSTHVKGIPRVPIYHQSRLKIAHLRPISV